MWDCRGVSTLFELDRLTVRASAESILARTRAYDLVDGCGSVVGSATQEAGSASDVVKRNAARSRSTMPTDVVVRDALGSTVMTVAKRRAGWVLPSVRIEAALANGSVVAVAHSHGRPPRGFDVMGADGTLEATVRRGGGAALFALADGSGRPAGAVELEANTLSAQLEGTARPHAYAIRYEPDAGMLLRIGALAAVLGFDSLRGV
jgi:hypothetical protein